MQTNSSFEIIDYSGATALFEDRDFDGPPELVVDEEIDDEGQLVEPTEVREPEPEYTDAGAELDEEDLEDRGARKLYVEQSDVWVAAEGFYLSDPESGKLKLVDYADYVSGHVRRLFTNAGELRERWRSPDDRRQIEEALCSARHLVRGTGRARRASRV